MEYDIFFWIFTSVDTSQTSQPDQPIVISMTEPKIQIVTIGQTVKFDCNARPTINIEGKQNTIFISHLKTQELY